MVQRIAFLSLALALGLVTTTTTANNDNPKILSIPLVPHHIVRQRRLSQGLPVHETFRPGYSRHDERFLQETQENFQARQVAGLFQGYGTHYADVWCGTPHPQRQTVIVDTGSGVTAFPCKGCNDCGVPKYHIDPLFDGQESSTYKKLSCDECLKGTCDSAKECHMGMSYAEGSSWKAKEVVDSCYVGGLHTDAVLQDDGQADDMDPYHAPAFAFDLKFGCQSSVTGLFKTQLADGIMGMDLAPAAFWWQMWNANKIEHKAFSMCFSRSDSAARTGTVAGAMSLGGTDPRLQATPMVYSKAPETSSSGFYVVKLRAIWLREGGAGTSVVPTVTKPTYKLDVAESLLNSGRVIVDSGTTDTYFSRKIAHSFADAYRKLMDKDYDHSKQKFTVEQLAQEPTIMFQIAGDELLNVVGTPGLVGDLDPDHPHDILVALPPEHYYEWDSDENAYVGRFYTDEGSGSVIGANAMMGHEVFFDIENHRIGWSESTCDYEALVKPFTNGNSLVPETEDTSVEVTDDATNDQDPGGDTTGDSTLPNVVTEPTNPPMNDDINPNVVPNNNFVPNNEPEPSHSSGGFEEPTDSYDNLYPEQAFCSSIKCQLSVLLVVIVVTIYCAMRFMKRQRYTLTDSHELELHTTSGEFINGKDGAYHQAGEYT